SNACACFGLGSARGMGDVPSFVAPSPAEAAMPPSVVAGNRACWVPGALALLALALPLRAQTPSPAQTVAEQAEPLVIPAPLVAAARPRGRGRPPPARGPAAVRGGPRWFLRRGRGGPGRGARLDADRLSVSGWTETSYTGSTARHSNLPEVFNDRANTFL